MKLHEITVLNLLLDERVQAGSFTGGSKFTRGRV